MSLHILGLCLSVLISVHTAVAGRAPAQADPDGAPDLAAAFPSLAHYPAATASLREALARRDSSGVLRGIADTFAARRWAHTPAWDRLAYIRLAEPGGFVVDRAGATTQLAPGRPDLGCSGALLEAVRLLWLPRVELAELAECDPEGGIDCEGDADFGHSLLRHLGRKLGPQWLADGGEPRRVRLQPRAIDRSLKQQDQLQLCAVSHRARKMQGRRYFHHMVVLDPARDRRGRAHLFDTTGKRGVAYRPVRSAQLTQYLRSTLARGNKSFAYAPGSARLHCLAVGRPDLADDALAATVTLDAASG